MHEEILETDFTLVAVEIAQSKHYSQAKECFREMSRDFEFFPKAVLSPPEQAHMTLHPNCQVRGSFQGCINHAERYSWCVTFPRLF
jgi:hypothetical protein